MIYGLIWQANVGNAVLVRYAIKVKSEQHQTWNLYHSLLANLVDLGFKYYVNPAIINIGIH